MNVNDEMLKKSNDIPGVMPMAMEHTRITTNSAAVHMRDIISL
ncbi:MAG TPA: hypothetical protein PK033_14535 [Acetivibrio sp.]|nr:hypothetical protein [Acetivibrio sp.]